jgi:tetratricopeptide (TPR) repeat protein
VGSVLRLNVKDYAGPTRWRWVLTGVSGGIIADHEVRADERSWQYEAFTDLQYYVSSYAAPDSYAEDGERIVAEVGQWAGSVIFGAVAEALAQAARKKPVTVRVVVPDGAEALLFWPLEVAYAGGRPLAVQDVTLVMETMGDDSADDTVRVEGRLRVLGLFSLPEGGKPLSLRRERRALVGLVDRIAARGKTAEVTVLQYGVSRERLRDVLEEADGWDLIHISGHGAPGELLLETAAGTPDTVTAAELADILAPARESVKLVTVSACSSAAATAAEQRKLLGLPVPRARFLKRTDPDASSPGSFVTELTGRLNCAVLAMRYSVDDDFAIGLSEKLYNLLADKGQPLARAVGMTVKELAASGRFPVLSAVTPALFGARAVELRLAAPWRTGAPCYGTAKLKMAGFPPEPERLVGRTGVMARSCAALAEASGVPAVLLHGMPGGGKTACALELAYTHEHAFDRLVWYKAPDEGMEIASALTNFALTLERYLEDFKMVHLVTTAEKLTGLLPRLTELMERSRLLIVIDNCESLLTGSGQWRDERWGQVIGALTAHRGLGRVIVTSRHVPTGPLSVIAEDNSPQTADPFVESVDALSADEALLLAWELPHLRHLIYGNPPGIVDRDTAQALALGVLRIAQGHPKLLELANGQAGHPERLADLVSAGNQAWRDQGGLPEGFFTTGATTANPGDYLQILATWAHAVTDGLPPAERDLYWFLCCLEETDRDRGVVAANWPVLWSRLGRDGQPPDLGQALKAVADSGLVATVTATADKDESYAIHPAVSNAGRIRAGQPFQSVVDAAAAFFWRIGLDYASGVGGQHGVNTGLIVRAGFSAVPYLTRQKQWQEAASILEFAFNRDPSTANAAAILPLAQEIADNLDSAGLLLATVTELFDPAAAEDQVRSYLGAAVAHGDHRAAMIATGRLAYRCHHTGRFTEALDLADQAVGYARQAEIGPWTTLGTEVQRLRMLSETQDSRTLISEVKELRDLMETLEDHLAEDEAARPWDVREALLNTDRWVKNRLEQWGEALAVNSEIIRSLQDRRAPASQIAVARTNDYGPLLALGKVSQARDLLLDCRRTFQEANELAMFAMALGALADAEDKLDHSDNAIKLARDALRYGYVAGEIGVVRDVYHNLGNYLTRRAEQPNFALACHLCAALVKALSGAADAESSVRAAAVDLSLFGNVAEPPDGIADLSGRISDIPGTDPAALIAQLSPDPHMAGQTLQDLIARARELADTSSEDAGRCTSPKRTPSRRSCR